MDVCMYVCQKVICKIQSLSMITFLFIKYLISLAGIQSRHTNLHLHICFGFEEKDNFMGIRYNH